MTIQQALIQPVIGNWIDLYKIDATSLGSSIFYFTSNTYNEGASSISFGGQVYTALPIDATGFEQSSTGALPRPKLMVSNVNKFLQPYLLQHNFFNGAAVTRTRTLSQYLDTGSTPDSTQQLPAQLWYIDQIESMNKSAITFVLASPLDRPGVFLPKRQILRDNGFPGAGFPYLTS